MGRFRIAREMRICAHPDCNVIFEELVTGKQKFCGRTCANRFNTSKEEVREKLREAAKKQWQNPEVRKKYCEAFKKRVVSEETKAKQSASGRKRWEDPEERKKQSVLLKGKNTGDKNPAKRPEVRKKIGKASLEMWEDPKFREKMKKVHMKHSQDTKERWKNSEYKERVLKAMFESCKLKPNKPEKLLDKLFQKLLPNEYKFVGDLSFILAGRNPDFIHVSQKKIIEFFGDYWHGEERTGIPNEQHEQERIDLFAQEGYQTLVIWEHELEDIKKVSNRILEF